jgi:MFS family permease
MRRAELWAGGRPEARAGGFTAVLRHPVAGRLLGAKLVSEVGDFAGLAALVLLGYGATGSAAGAALVLAARALPALAVAALVGGWLDQPPRRTALVWLTVAGAVAIAVPAAAPGAATAIVAASLLGALRAAFRSVAAAVIAESVDPAARLPLFGLATAVNQAAQVLGVATGATVSLAAGARPALVADAVSFLVAAAVLARLPVAAKRLRPVRPGVGTGVRVIWQHRTLRWLALATLATVVPGQLPEALAPSIAHRAWVPAVMAASAAGGTVFAVFASRLAFLRRPANQLRVAMALGVALAATGAATLLHAPDWWYVAGNASVGAGLGWLSGAQASFADLAPTERMGQVEATMVAANSMAGGAGVLLLGALADGVAPTAAYACGGAIVFGTAWLAKQRLTGRQPVT